MAALQLRVLTLCFEGDAQHPSICNMGPMAQDFYSASVLGENDKGISVVDAQGVAFAAIQGLNAKLEARSA